MMNMCYNEITNPCYINEITPRYVRFFGIYPPFCRENGLFY